MRSLLLSFFFLFFYLDSLYKTYEPPCACIADALPNGHAPAKVLTRGLEQTMLASCQVLHRGVVSAKSSGTHKVVIYIRSPDKIIIFLLSNSSISFLLSFLLFIHGKCETGRSSECAWIQCHPKESRSICSGLLCIWKPRDHPSASDMKLLLIFVIFPLSDISISSMLLQSSLT